MLVAAVQTPTLLALGVLSFFFGQTSALSVPTPRHVDGQTPLLPPQGVRKHRNGESPPLRNTIGWVDPRLNGGQFLDVRLRPLSTLRRLISRPAITVYHRNTRRTAEYHHLIRVRS